MQTIAKEYDSHSYSGIKESIFDNMPVAVKPDVCDPGCVAALPPGYLVMANAYYAYIMKLMSDRVQKEYGRN